MVHCLAVLALLFAPAAASAGTIAIAYFDNNTGDAALDPLRKGFADMLITDLSNVASLQIVERDKLNQVLSELKLSQSKFIDPRTAQKLGKGLAAEFIMTGGYVLRGDGLRVDVRVIEVKTGRVAASEKVEGKKADFFAIEKDLVDILIKTLDVKLSTGERGKLRSNATESFDAWQKYSAALDAKDRGDAAEAGRLFQAALDADPNYRAAKSATERLQVIFQRDDAARAAEIDKAFKGLDPKAPSFAHQVDDLLTKLSNNDTKQLRQKIALLTFLAERDLTPGSPGFSRVALEVNVLVGRYENAPDAEVLLPPVCEYLILHFPKDDNTRNMCRLLLETIARNAKDSTAERTARWDANWKNVTLDWEVALKAVMPDAFQLFRLYAKKRKRP
ncbi:MAG TPA: FlgO family outer membrane protein [Kofleriaceae bacterium]|jgi:TolB-like protein|nr:FlgO family outer membrane protein [Kofleriaceae bacterium]